MLSGQFMWVMSFASFQLNLPPGFQEGPLNQNSNKLIRSVSYVYLYTIRLNV